MTRTTSTSTRTGRARAAHAELAQPGVIPQDDGKPTGTDDGPDCECDDCDCPFCTPGCC